MPTMKLTKTNIDTKAVPSTAAKPNDMLYWDVTPKGFGIRVSPAGKKVFIVQGRVKGSDAPAARFTIGEYGPFTVDQARDEAEEILRQLKKGIDPRQVAKQEKAVREQAKVEQVSLRHVADAYMRDNSRRKGPLKESSRATIDRHLKTTFAAWENQSIFTITREMVKDRFNEITEGGLHGKRGAPGQANQAFQILRAILNYAMDEYRGADGEPILRKNPVNDAIKKWQQLGSREERRISETKIGAVWQMLTTSRSVAVTRSDRARLDLVRFLVLTGSRFGEAAALTWDRVNIDDNDAANCWWHIPNPKSGRPITLPLSSQAVALLKGCERVEGSDFVFPSWSKSGHVKDPRATLEEVRRVADIKELSAHDLRRTFADIGVDYCKLDLFKIKLLMQHSMKKDVTVTHYLRSSALQYLQPEVQKIGDWIEQQAQIAASENVKRLPSRTEAA